MSWVGWRCQKCRHEMRHNPRWCPMCAYTVYDPIHDHERPDWVNPPSTEPETPPAGTSTSAEGSQAASEALSGQTGPFPAMCLIPAGTFTWPNSVVAIRYLDGARLSDSQAADVQRLVPVGPLLELVGQWREICDELNVKGDSRTALAYDLHAFQLNAVIARLLGESPEPNAQEGTNG